MKKETFSLTRVVSRDFITDWFQSLRNMFGLRLRGYESRINNTLKEMLVEMNSRYNPLWFRISIDPLIGGTVMITIYGEAENG